MDSNTLAGVVVLYHPEQSVLENIESYITELDTLYIVNNSTPESNILQILLEYDQTKLLYSGENIGIAKALNLALEQAAEEKFEWLMTFDQDSAFCENDFSLFLNACREVQNDRVALFSPLHHPKLLSMKKSHAFFDSSYVMTSANRVNVAVARRVGGYDENLFIDEVDHEFCFRLQAYNYTILVHHGIAILHTLGEKSERYKNITLYDPKRLYYMSRNYLYLRKKYYDTHQTFFRQRDRYLLSFFKNQLFYGEKRLENLKNIFYGILDYKNGHFGKGYYAE